MDGRMDGWKWIVLCFPDMPAARDHEACRALVCALCFNSQGDKALRLVGGKEAAAIKDLRPGYDPSNPSFGAGLCKTCVFLLRRREEGVEVPLVMPEQYSVVLARDLRSTVDQPCSCEICRLAKLAGFKFKKWQREMKGKARKKVVRLCMECYTMVEEGSTHQCSVSTTEAVSNLSVTLPEDIRGKLAQDFLASRAAAAGDGGQVLLPQARGGHRIPVQYGEQTRYRELPTSSLSHADAITLGHQNNLSTSQLHHVLADLRTVHGRSFVEPGLVEAAIVHNNKYEEFFVGEEVVLEAGKGRYEPKTIFFCSKLVPFLNKVCEERGVKLDEQRLKVMVDSGKEWEKVCLTMSPNLPTYSAAPFPLPQSTPEEKRKRRSREDGVRRDSSSTTGQSTILFLAVVKGMKETAGNFAVLWEKLQLSQVRYTVSADFAALMPLFGLMSCSSSHPCLYCPLRRLGTGQWEGRWTEEGEWVQTEVGLRTIGSNASDYNAWLADGAKHGTVHTQQHNSCISPVLVCGEGDTEDTTVLEKAGTPGVHLLLGTNTVLDHCVPFFDSRQEMLEILRQAVSVIPHSYQGAEGAFEGPQCARILDEVEVLQNFVVGEQGFYIIALLQAFKEVKDGVFGVHLAPNYEDILSEFRHILLVANEAANIPITPKLHTIAFHVVQWCRRTGTGLAAANEAAVEAAHHTWLQVWANYKVNDEKSDCFKSRGLKCLARINANNE